MDDVGQNRSNATPFCRDDVGLVQTLVTVFLVSVAVIALQLALMRYLSVASWYHFVHLVISTALLGFGASGSLLSFVGDRLRRSFDRWHFIMSLLFVLSLLAGVRVAQMLPLDVRYILYSWEQGMWAVLYHLLLVVPFFIGGTMIGLALMSYRRHVALVYGVNLAGSGAGAAFITLCMFAVPPQRLVQIVAVLGVFAAIVWLFRRREEREHRREQIAKYTLCSAVTVYVICELVFLPLPLEVEPYKKLAHLRSWAEQSDAEHVATRNGPRAHLDVYASPRLHDTPFAGLRARQEPPSQLAMLADGSGLATVYRIDSPKEADILDHTPMAVPYKLLDQPRVLLLNEAGGLNVWLALRNGAEQVTVVQRNPQVIDLMEDELSRYNGNIFNRDDVTVVNADPRLFLENTDQAFNLIQLAGTQSLTAGAGLRSLHENYLLTTQGIREALRHLKDRGMLTATRGVQTPPRDNIKLLATFVEALETTGIAQPGDHVAQYRNYLAATVTASPSRFLKDRCPELVDTCNRERLDVSWAPCRRSWSGDQINAIPGPNGKDYSYFHYAAKKIVGDEREDFYRDWLYNVRPATDEKPYFYNFFKWSSLSTFIDTYGKRWLQRLELGYVVLVLTIVEVVVVGGVLILLPLRWLRRPRETTYRFNKLTVVGYFVALGLSFMIAEIVFILEMNRFLGDPVYAAAGVLTAFLLFSGVGSAVSHRLSARPGKAIAIGVGCIAIYMGSYIVGGRELLSYAGHFSTWCRIGLGIAVLAPVSFFMGWPFPNGLTLVHRGAPSLVPWAWGVNGFASVAASPAAILLSLAYGFTAVLMTAAGLYVAAALIALGLPGRKT